MRLIIDWLFPCYWYFDTIKASAMMSRFAHSCKNFSQAHEKSQKLPGWRIFAFIAIFRSSLSHLQNLRELREITGWAIFHDTWDFRIFFFVTLKTNSKSSGGFYQICAAEIAKNRQRDDFSWYLRFLPFFSMLMIITSNASCRLYSWWPWILHISPCNSAMEILSIALIGVFGLC